MVLVLVLVQRDQEDLTDSPRDVTCSRIGMRSISFMYPTTRSCREISDMDGWISLLPCVGDPWHGRQARTTLPRGWNRVASKLWPSADEPIARLTGARENLSNRSSSAQRGPQTRNQISVSPFCPVIMSGRSLTCSAPTTAELSSLIFFPSGQLHSLPLHRLLASQLHRFVWVKLTVCDLMAVRRTPSSGFPSYSG
jgi:hypothetical protein